MLCVLFSASIFPNVVSECLNQSGGALGPGVGVSSKLCLVSSAAAASTSPSPLSERPKAVAAHFLKNTWLYFWPLFFVCFGEQVGALSHLLLSLHLPPCTVVMAEDHSPAWKQYSSSQGSFIKLCCAVLNFSLPCDLFLGNI